MQTWRRTKEFRDLEEEWNKRLAESGFEDQEKTVGEERILKTPSHYAYYYMTTISREHHSFYGKSSRTMGKDMEIEKRQQYFQLLSFFFDKEQCFADDSDRRIMMRTSEGWTITEISAELKELGKTKFNRDTIRYIRRRYEHKWGIRTWKPQQMVSRRVTTKS